MRRRGGETAVMWRSNAPLSSIALSSACRLSWANLVVHRGALDFFGRRHALEDLLDAGHAEALHSLPDHLGLDLGSRRALEHELLERIDERHHLVQRDAALVAG